MLLYIIRHGQTQWNVEKRLQGRTDIPLDAEGIRLAKVTAEQMKDIPFDLAITSPLSRAKDTAKIVLGDRNIPLLEDERLTEISFGSWEGLSCSRSNFEIPTDYFEDFYIKPFDFVTANDGETIRQVCERLKGFYEELIANEAYQDKTILISSHGCACRALLNNVYENKEDFWRGSVPMNCAVNIVEVKNGKATLLEEDKIYYSKEDCVDFYAIDK